MIPAYGGGVAYLHFVPQAMSTLYKPCHRFSSGPVVSADWWANGKQVFTASWDRTIKLWDAETAKVVHTLEGNFKMV